MKVNDLLKSENSIIRVLDMENNMFLIIECLKKSMPKWVNCEYISKYAIYNSSNLFNHSDIKVEPSAQKIMHERFSIIAPILPSVGNKRKRCMLINQVGNEKKLSNQTICNYLWLYLSQQTVMALLPSNKISEKCLNSDEKNCRWALNKYYYTKYKNSLKTAYTLMLKEKYRDKDGNLLSEYPSFYQFRYFYRKYNTKEKSYISRDGLKNYQRNNRPLLGDGVQEFAPIIGYGMIDATICDIYLINDIGNLIGRPILTACVDAYSGLCCGYSLSWEGGVYSLRGLMLNIISDKINHCKRFGISINKSDWNCDRLPGVLISDMGKEYTSETFEQIADLGVTVTNLPPYRPELKGTVEKFFDIIQELYKPHLKSKGVIEPDYMERGAHDYRKDACLTMNDFEKIILHCIVYYNSKRVLENFPFTENMLAVNIKPYSNEVWNYCLTNNSNLIKVDAILLTKTLLPRANGRFTRKGLIANRLRYKNANYTEKYLSGGNAVVAYNPEDVTQIWLIENYKYIEFELIESRFKHKSLEDVSILIQSQKASINLCENENLQAKIDLIGHIEAISSLTKLHDNVEVKNIRNNRTAEQRKTHIDYIKKGEQNV